MKRGAEMGSATKSLMAWALLGLGLGMLGGLVAHAEEATAPTTTTAGTDWPKWRGPQGTGITPEAGWNTNWPKEGPPVLWKLKLGPSVAPPAMSDGRLIAMGYLNGRDVVYALDPTTGSELWRYSYPCAIFDNQHGGGPAAMPVVDGDRVYTLGREG